MAKLRELAKRLYTDGTFDHLLQLAALTGLGHELVGDVDHPPGDFLFALTRQNDPDDVRIVLHHPSEQGRPIHPGHPHVRYDDVAGRCQQLLQGGFAPRQKGHFPHLPLLAQKAPEAVQDVLLVVHEKDLLHVPQYLNRRCGAPSLCPLYATVPSTYPDECPTLGEARPAPYAHDGGKAMDIKSNATSSDSKYGSYLRMLTEPEQVASRPAQSILCVDGDEAVLAMCVSAFAAASTGRLG